MRTIITGFLNSTRMYPENPALSVEGNTYSYRQLLEIASSYATALEDNAAPGEPHLTAILASRSLPAFAGIIATLIRGYGYVPLGPKQPSSRLRNILDQTGCRSIIVDRDAAEAAIELLEVFDRKCVVLMPDGNLPGLDRIETKHIVLHADRIERNTRYEPREASPDSVAYIIFTSGSTGVPKGVMVAHRNVLPLIDFLVERYGITTDDRIPAVFPLTFDPSLKDMLLAWERGACLCCPSEKDLLNPGRFILRSELTIWNSVPSLIMFMKRFGSLKKARYPRLRLSIFGGEPLLVESVAAWSEAAPNSAIENLYGPAELTISCTYYRWNWQTSPAECIAGVVPIGYPNPFMKALVCDEQLKEVPVGREGELLMSGPQVSLGYLKDPEKTARAFVVPPGKNEVYYRTGDLVKKLVENGPLVFLGRIDLQVKVLGNRVELGDVEAAVRKASGLEEVVAVGWPPSPAGPLGIEVFIAGRDLDVGTIKKSVQEILPEYMVPNGFHVIENIPLNENGKFDRKALCRMLEEGA